MNSGNDPTECMTKYKNWIDTIAGNRQKILLMWPVAFDYTCLSRYWLHCFNEPMFYFDAIDLKSYAFGKLNLETWKDADEDMPVMKSYKPIVSPEKKHHPLCDALSQGQWFFNIKFNKPIV